MAIAPHEYEPSPFDQNTCQRCPYDNNHPMHAKYSRDWKVFQTLDSGKRESYDSGMVRDVQSGKPRFDLLFPLGVPYDQQFLTRVAGLLARGAEKYSERNWEQAQGEVELARFKASALRHLIQYLADETDEDHMAAVVFNLMGAHLVEWKLQKNDSQGNS